MLGTIREILAGIVRDIDAGNSNISEEEALGLVKILKEYTDKTEKLSKYQACRYLNMSRASFDNYVRDGIIPRGMKEAGFKELFWRKKDLDDIKWKRNGDKKEGSNPDI